MGRIKKSNPLTEEYFEGSLENFDSREESEHYFSVSIGEIEESEHMLSYKWYKEFDDGDEVVSPEEFLTGLQSLQDTVRENTEVIMDELENE